jgi:nitrogen regulatory protein PII
VYTVRTALVKVNLLRITRRDIEGKGDEKEYTR